jgi:hypothetical protein
MTGRVQKSRIQMQNTELYATIKNLELWNEPGLLLHMQIELYVTNRCVADLSTDLETYL